MFFRKILQIDKFKGADFKYDNSFLKILAQNYPRKTFLVPNLAIFIISRNFAHKILQLDQYEGADFKFNDKFLKFWLKNTQIRYFWSKFKHFCFFFHKIFQLDKFKDANFKYDNLFFKFQLENTQIRRFCFLIWHFHFFTNFCSQKNSRVLLSNIMILFSNSSPARQIRGIQIRQ